MKVHEIRALRAFCSVFNTRGFVRAAFTNYFMFFLMAVAEKHSLQHFQAGMQKVGEKNCHFKACFLINYR